MERLLSTYLFVSRKLTRELISQIGDAGFRGVEIFCSRSHFDYTNRAEIQNIAGVLADAKLKLASLHAPTSRDLSATREGGQPLSICEVERVRRIEAMDELKRAIDVAEELPFSRMIFHMGGSRETADPRKRDAANDKPTSNRRNRAAPVTFHPVVEHREAQQDQNAAKQRPSRRQPSLQHPQDRSAH